MAYITDDGLGTGTYKLYIQANGEIIANSNSWYLFGLFSKLTQINNLELLDTSKVIDMYSMFSGCSSLTFLNLSSFNTANVSNMANMFDSCTSLSMLDISNMEFVSVTNHYNMFYLVPNNIYIIAKDENAGEWISFRKPDANIIID